MNKFLTEEEIDELVSKVTVYYTAMETEMLIDFASRLKAYGGTGGTLDWYTKILAEMGTFTKKCKNTIDRLSKLGENQLKNVLKKVQKSSMNYNDLEKAFGRKLISINPSVLLNSKPFQAILNNVFKDANNNITLIKTKALEATKRSYIDTVTKAYIEVQSGAKSYEQSIQDALIKLSDSGFSTVNYESGKTYQLETAVRREVLSATNKAQNKTAEQATKDVGTDFVEVSSHLGARISDKREQANHYGWQGKIYHIGGSKEVDGVVYDDFVEKTGYGTIEGLGGVNCRHRFFPYIMGVSIPSAIQYDEKQNKELYLATQQQRALERKIRKLKKRSYLLQKGSNAYNKNQLQLRGAMNDIEALCNQYNLKRDFTRERVVEQIKK